jgi:hypothetical protein
VAGATTTPTSLELPASGKLSWEAYEQLGVFLGALTRALPFWIGDFLLYGEEVFGEEYAQVEASLQLRPQTLANYRSVAFHVPPSRRKKGLSYGVHEAVAYLPPRERDEMLSLALKQGWKREDVRYAMQRKREIEAQTGERIGPQDVLALPPPPKNHCPHCGGILP